MSGHSSDDVPWLLPTTPREAGTEGHERPPGISPSPPTSLDGGSSGPHAPGAMYLAEPGGADDYSDDEFDDLDRARPAPPAPIDWRVLSPRRAEHELRILDEWVNWLRHEFGIPPTIIPPLWHRHSELLWELSALRTHFLTAHDAQASGSAPIAFFEDFAEARNRLRDLVATCGTRLDRDRPTRVTTWPGEAQVALVEEQPITDRAADFDAFVAQYVEARGPGAQAQHRHRR